MNRKMKRRVRRSGLVYLLQNCYFLTMVSLFLVLPIAFWYILEAPGNDYNFSNYIQYMGRDYLNYYLLPNPIPYRKQRWSSETVYSDSGVI